MTKFLIFPTDNGTLLVNCDCITHIEFTKLDDPLRTPAITIHYGHGAGASSHTLIFKDPKTANMIKRRIVSFLCSPDAILLEIEQRDGVET